MDWSLREDLFWRISKKIFWTIIIGLGPWFFFIIFFEGSYRITDISRLHEPFEGYLSPYPWTTYAFVAFLSIVAMIWFWRKYDYEDF